MYISRHLAFVGALALVGLMTSTARATVPVSLDVDYVTPVDSGPASDGFGAQLHFGPRVELGILQWTGEVGLGLHGFSEGPTVFRGVIGSRLGFGALVRPTIYGHLGVGHANWSVQDDLTHLTLDVGGALDLQLAPAFELGAHLGYNFIFGNGTIDPFGFLAIGGHFTVILDGHAHTHDHDDDD